MRKNLKKFIITKDIFDVACAMRANGEFLKKILPVITNLCGNPTGNIIDHTLLMDAISANEGWRELWDKAGERWADAAMDDAVQYMAGDELKREAKKGNTTMVIWGDKRTHWIQQLAKSRSSKYRELGREAISSNKPLPIITIEGIAEDNEQSS